MAVWKFYLLVLDTEKTSSNFRMDEELREFEEGRRSRKCVGDFGPKRGAVTIIHSLILK